MNNCDTISLLKACNQGCKYATNSMENLYSYIKDSMFRKLIDDYNDKHAKIGDRCHQMLNEHNADEKDPKPMATMFSKMSMDMKMLADNSNEKIAELMFDGCNMGIKSVGKYVNRYTDASEPSRVLANDLIDVEYEFMHDLMAYL